MQSVQENHLYEYAVVRYLPSVEREEFVNVGLIMMCKRRRWIKVKFYVDAARILAFNASADINLLLSQLEGFKIIASGKARGALCGLETHERFRWLTAVRSACISTSRPHPGKTSDLELTFSRLMNELVLPV
ncbi:MAG: DUF3037 domain-containing protein [Candidatus Amulumruptor caecigallinarius]|nr:DUF3037 domain-containing protein [Candidatus Amulumruptor caecigallinarius]